MSVEPIMVLLTFDLSLMRVLEEMALPGGGGGGHTNNDKITQPIELDYAQLKLGIVLKVIYNLYQISH